MTSKRNLEARLERLELESRRGERRGRAHRIIVDGISHAEARARYEQEAGVQIGPDDLVIFRTIIHPGQETAA